MVLVVGVVSAMDQLHRGYCNFSDPHFLSLCVWEEDTKSMRWKQYLLKYVLL